MWVSAYLIFKMTGTLSLSLHLLGSHSFNITIHSFSMKAVSTNSRQDNENFCRATKCWFKLKDLCRQWHSQKNLWGEGIHHFLVSFKYGIIIYILISFRSLILQCWPGGGGASRGKRLGGSCPKPPLHSYCMPLLVDTVITFYSWKYWNPCWKKFQTHNSSLYPFPSRINFMLWTLNHTTMKEGRCLTFQ